LNVDDIKTITAEDIEKWLGITVPIYVPPEGDSDPSSGGDPESSGESGLPDDEASGPVTGPPEGDSDPSPTMDFAAVYSKFSELSSDQIVAKKKEGIPQWVNVFKRGTYFSEKSLNTFNQALDKDFVFPFLIKLDIPIETPGPLAGLLIKNDLLDSFNSHIASKITWPSDTTRYYSNYYGGVINGDANTNFNLLYQLQLNNCKIVLAPQAYGSKFPSGMDTHIDTLSQNNNILTYGEKPVSNDTDIQKLLQKLKSAKFKEDLQKLVSTKVLSPGDIASGKLAHQETLMYEIAKYKIDKDNNEIYIQSMFLPITEKDMLSYYDTQVLPYQNYFYKIFAHKAVLASRYKPTYYDDTTKVRFLNEPIPGPDGWHPGPNIFALKYEIEAYIETIRVPYYNVAPVNTKTDMLNYSRIEDNPPLPPDVNIVPFRNVNNKLLFLLNNSIGQYDDYPIIINDQERTALIKTYIAQNKVPPSKITFKSDDSQGTYEIYRTTSLPEIAEHMFEVAWVAEKWIIQYGQIADFTGPEVKKIALKSIGADKKDSFIDDILPNIDYYYLFRFMDLHNKYSNPTNIYKVRMVHESGYAPYLKISIIDFKESQKEKYNKNFSSIKKMNKYLYIKPNDRQTLIDGSVTELNEVEGDYGGYTYKPGDQSLKESVFGKKFKIRLTSKQTGKKIDINMDVQLPKTIIND